MLRSLVCRAARRSLARRSEQATGDYSKCKGGASPRPLDSGDYKSYFAFLFQTTYSLPYRIIPTVAGLVIMSCAFSPTWTIPFNRYWIDVQRECGSHNYGRGAPTAYGVGKKFTYN
jgi:hypothetical protein